MKPLDGLRILDLTRVLAGPFATAILADLGAEVIKLEPPQGDDYRHIGPFREGESALFALTNRGKKSVVIDLKSPDGQALARRIAGTCDVVVENFRRAPGRGTPAAGEPAARGLLDLGLRPVGAFGGTACL